MSKNKLDCTIVRELLPLYHDNVMGEEARVSVEEHLAECTACAARLEELDSNLPALDDGVDTGKSFAEFTKRRKRKRIFIYLLCFVIGALVVGVVALHIARTANIIPYSPDAFSDSPMLIYHYKIENCPYIEENAHYPEDDHALFIYMKEPVGCDCDITREGGDINLAYKHAIWNPQQYDIGMRYRILIIPIDSGCTTLSINGKKIYDIGEPDKDLPPYVLAYHELDSMASGMWDEKYIGDVDVERPCDFFVYYPSGDEDGDYIKWDLDGNVIENTIK